MTAARIAGILAGTAAAVSAFVMRANAAGYRLTLTQTRALYGDILSGTYYDANDRDYSDLDFRFAGYTTDWITDAEGEQGIWIPFYDVFNAGAGGQTAIDAMMYDWSKTAPAVVYEASMLRGTFVPTQGSNNIANVQLNPSVNISNIKAFNQNIWWSANLQPSYDGVNITSGLAWGYPPYSWAVSHTSAGNVTNRARYTGSGSSAAYAYGACRLYNPDAVIPSYYRAAFYNVPVSIPETDNFDYTGIDLHLNAVNYAYQGATLDHVLLFIQCPEIDGTFIGPTMPVTTSATTTRPQWTAETGTTYTTGVTIDNFSEDIQEIIRNQRWQLYYDEIQIRNQMAMNENLRIIINQLDDIYNAMILNADVPLNTGGSMWQEMAGALTGMTTNTMPNYVLQGLTFWADCSQEILVRFDFLVPLGAFALTMLVIYYVLFKGRTS